MIKKKTYSNVIFLSKSISDTVVGASSISFMTILTCYGYWPLGFGLCVFWIVLDFSVCSISIFNLLLITWHRYQQLKNPFEVTEELTTFRWFKLILVWACPFLFWLCSVVPIANHNLKDNDCIFSFVFTYVLIADLFLFILPIVVLLFLNILTYRELRKKKKRMSTRFKSVNATILRNLMNTYVNENSTTNSTNDESLERTESKNTRTRKRMLNKDDKAVICLVSVSLLFFCCWIIFLVTWPLRASDCNCISEVLFEIGYWSAYICSTAYPVLLLIFHETIKRKFLHIFHKKNQNVQT